MISDFHIDLNETTPNDWGSTDRMIKVIGVGGGGCNAVSYMFRSGIVGCSFVVCNTDSQALEESPVPVKIQMGAGLGAGTNPIKGRNAALDSQAEIEKKVLDTYTKMLFITAGMGGGTGTGAAPVIAKMAKEKGILTVAVVTLPFENEGDRAMTRAIDGVQELEKNVDSLLIINNEKLYKHYGAPLTHEAFPKSDEVLATAVKGIVEIVKKRGYINVDFEDVSAMMKDSGMALMGYGEGSGKDRIQKAVKEAFESPLLNDYDLTTARNVLVNVTGGKNEKGLTMDDLNEINRLVEQYTGGANRFKSGLIYDTDPNVGDKIHITSIVTGLKFIDILGSHINIGNYIMITRSYTADLSNPDCTFPDPDDAAGTVIGYNSSDNRPMFHFEPEDKPALLVPMDGQIADLENIPAIRRQ